jgi:excisionase family DNA binding protein
MEDTELEVGHGEAVMDVKNAAEFLKISEAKLRRMVTDNLIPHFRIGSRVLFSRRKLNEWIDTLIVQPAGPISNVANEIWKDALGG